MATYPSTSRDGHPFLRTPLALAIACFLGALVTDIAYVRTVEPMWYTFSVWLLTAGLLVALVAALGVPRLLSRRWRVGGAGLVAGSVVALALVLEILNAFVHSRDGWTAVVPDGLILSAVTVALLAVRGWFFTLPADGRAVA